MDEGRRDGDSGDDVGPSGVPPEEPGTRTAEPESGEVEERTRVSRRAWIGRFLGPALAIAVYFLLPGGEGGVPPEARGVAAVGALMAVWWVTEALPLAATALLPIALFPLLGVGGIEDATAPYANDIVFLFMGGFMLALAMQRWGLHRRIALRTVLAVGTKPVRVIGGFMLATGFLSMWVSNTATTVVMLPIGLSVLTLVFERMRGGERAAEEEHVADAVEKVSDRGAANFATCLMLAIAYAASIGSLATLIGTPPNLFMAGFLSETYGIEIGFGQWMLFGLPLAVVLMVVAWLLLTKVVYPTTMTDIPGGRELFRSELAKLGPMSRGERIVGIVFICTALLWITREPISNYVPGFSELSDAGIAILAALVLFAVPVDARRGVFTLDWTSAAKLPWGVLLLFGGGLSLASAIGDSGLDAFIGRQVGALGGVPSLVLVLVAVVSVIFLTEMTSNTATAATFLPILAGVALGLNADVLLLVVPAAVAATCAFMLPVATPPNAIVFGSGHVTIPQMVKAGWWLNLTAIVLIPLAVYTLGGWALGIALS
ncbi:sodium-dependent dicarboxylate transporter 2/3/5 [Halopolyspora algeriensis]|uniref:Sodium-dependent dicarboxylate transporter SdcS n=1 Tax=Halopolyspora algeriensis TaxID=1500506 RepID=A0A368VIG4_9ACTN|nr:DASS family sodium-coupled anion symporter [Halopolyspora algeriensis]RCW40159.1 sodium-dependent dicarboxylate transporter 2/3/5 [Halopolyspora algeriensis]TQM46359.1 sodium-dependent dicarboxylate transporter 2/3/5 [Halopolyspora algeriensis]